MSKQSTTVMYGVPFAQTLRHGQKQAIDVAIESNRKSINVQLPTGYGKTFTAAAIYSVLKSHGVVDRMLYVVPTTVQLDQFVDDGSKDFKVSGVSGSLTITDIGFSSYVSLDNHKFNKSQIFAITVQGLSSKTRSGERGTSWEIITALMSTGKWMVVIDEYHHYGVEAHWGETVSRLKYDYLLAMSATPYRVGDDSAFGKPDVTVKYGDAVEEKAVKPLRCCVYTYRIDAVCQDGELKSFTTDELNEYMGSTPDKIDRELIKKHMRWSPKYVSPLVETPLNRLHENRIKTGIPFQAIINTMSCTHAKLVFDQVCSMFGDVYRIDWVGTGKKGRTIPENKDIMRKFLPPKRSDGSRYHEDIELDVLISVDKAAEGLDSVYVSEIIHLTPVNINNRSNQKNGRASRFIKEAPEIVGHVNVDSTSQYASLKGDGVQYAMDCDITDYSPDDPNNANYGDDFDSKCDMAISPICRLPENPGQFIRDIECINIDDGTIDRYKKVICEITSWSYEDATNPEHSTYDRLQDMAIATARKAIQQESETMNAKSAVQKWNKDVDEAVSYVTGLAIDVSYGREGRREKSIRGDFKRRINTAKYHAVGPISKDIKVLKRHYDWVRNLEAILRGGRIPSWLK